MNNRVPSSPLMSTEVEAASNERLAECILDYADGQAMSTSFLRVAAIELAQRILPNAEPRERPAEAVPWHMSGGGGAADGRRSTKRNMDNASWMFGGGRES